MDTATHRPDPRKQAFEDRKLSKRLYRQVGQAIVDYNMIEEGDRVMALLPGGGYAENALIHEDMAIPIPASMSFEEAAAIPEAFLTAQEALFGLGGLVPGQTVLVHAAAGGVGSAAPVCLSAGAGERGAADLG